MDNPDYESGMVFFGVFMCAVSAQTRKAHNGEFFTRCDFGPPPWSSSLINKPAML